MPASSRYPSFIRPALLPGLLGAVALLVAIAVVGSGWFYLFRFVICILAAIIGVFAIQGRAWWWLIGLVPIVILWNPVLPIDLDPTFWAVAHLVAAVVFVASGLLIKVPTKDDARTTGRR